MKKMNQVYLGALAVILLIGGSVAFTGCKKENYTKDRNSTNVISTTEPTSTAFDAELLTYNVGENNGYAWTWKIIRDVQKQQHELGHFDFIDGYLCIDDENYSDKLSDHVIGAYYSEDGGITWTNNVVIWGNTKSTDDCFVGDVLKIEGEGDNLLVKLILDEQFAMANQLAVYRTGGQVKCGIIEFSSIGCPLNEEECWYEEGAWSAGSRYVSKGNWATYTEYAEGTVTLYAGQTHEAGTVHFSAVSGGSVTVTITLNDGFRLKLDEFNHIVKEAVKVQGYSIAPAGNPAPGLFTYYKGTSLTFDVDAANFYGVHLSVERIDNCPE